MTEDTPLPFDLPAVQRKKVTADFAGGSISSDGGLVLLRAAERRLGLAETLAGCIREWRDPERTVHTLPAMLRFRMFAIACGYEDADDCDELRADPLFKLAVGRAPESGRDLCSQPTMSRLENAPSRVEVARLTAALVDVFCRSFPIPPAAITLDIDDTCDAVHGHQQLSLFNGHYDTRCFLPIHVYHVESGKPVAVLLRPDKTPSGVEVRTLLKHLTRRIRRHWPRTRLTFRGDSHYGRTEAMAWCEANGVDYIFGLAGNAALHGLSDHAGPVLHGDLAGDQDGPASLARLGDLQQPSQCCPSGWATSKGLPTTTSVTVPPRSSPPSTSPPARSRAAAAHFASSSRRSNGCASDANTQMRSKKPSVTRRPPSNMVRPLPGATENPFPSLSVRREWPQSRPTSRRESPPSARDARGTPCVRDCQTSRSTRHMACRR